MSSVSHRPDSGATPVDFKLHHYRHSCAFDKPTFVMQRCLHPWPRKRKKVTRCVSGRDGLSSIPLGPSSLQLYAKSCTRGEANRGVGSLPRFKMVDRLTKGPPARLEHLWRISLLMVSQSRQRTESHLPAVDTNRNGVSRIWGCARRQETRTKTGWKVLQTGHSLH